MPCVLYQSLYQDPDAARHAEHVYCLTKNIARPEFHQIVLFCEGDVSLPKSDKVIRIPYQGRPTFDLIFDHASTHYPGYNIVVANADIHFDETLSVLDLTDIEGKFFCLSTYDVDQTHGWYLRDWGSSQDSWIFKSPLRPIKADFPMGILACDNRLAAQAAKAGLEVSNPSKTIRSYHIHQSNERKYWNTPPLEGDKLEVPPVELGKTVEKKKPQVSIVIPTYNHLEDCLRPCLESIKKYTNLDPVEVIVVANGCTDGTKAYVESLGDPFILLNYEEQLGYTKATNRGIEKARGDYILLLNNDIVLLEAPRNQWIDMHLQPFSDPRVGMTGPLSLHDPYVQRQVIIFFCAMIKREVIEKVGLLDEIFSPGGHEDIDFTIRMENAGYKWVQVPPEAVLVPAPGTNLNVGPVPIYHKGEGTFDSIPEYGLTIIKRNGLVTMKRYAKHIRLAMEPTTARPGFVSVHPTDRHSHLKMPYDKLEFEDGTVDEIVASEAFIPPDKYDACLKEWQRVLKPDGKLLITGKPTTNTQRGRVFDCFPFFNELDLLEMRLSELENVVDYFVISELPVTHKGDPKPLYFAENKDRFAKWKDKIIHVVRTDYPLDPDPWSRERFQRDACKDALIPYSPKDDDIVMISDCDEIPKAERVAAYRVEHGLMAFKQRLYSFYLNLCGGYDKPEPGVWSKILPYKQFKDMTPCQVRYTDCSAAIIEDGGWHFNYMGGVEKVIKKLESWAHQEWNKEQFKDPQKILEAINSGKDPFGRDDRWRFVDIDESLPQYVRNHYSTLLLQGYIRQLPFSNSGFSGFDFEPVTVTVEISTKNRYDTTLPHVLMSVIGQTRKPEKLTIYDDTDHDKRRDLREDPLYNHIFTLLQDKGIGWEVMFGANKGQIFNHQLAIERSPTTWIWRLDDDDWAEPDCLEKLIRNITPKVGAVSSLVLTPGQYVSESIASSQIQDIYSKPNLQWARFNGVREVDHFNNTFLFRKEAAAHGYPLYLSPAGHREETIFSYEMKRKGWKLLVDPEAVVWHLRNPNGGIRSHQQQEFWNSDEARFTEKMKDWGITPSQSKLIILDNGLGDHYAFKPILPALRERYKGKEIILSVCYPEVFSDEPGLKLISIGEGKSLDANADAHNVYKWMWDHNWKKSLTDAYRSMWLQ